MKTTCFAKRFNLFWWPIQLVLLIKISWIDYAHPLPLPRNRISHHPSHIAPKSQYYCFEISILLIFVFNTTDIEFQLYFIFHRQLVRRKVVETRKRVSTLWLWQVNVPKQRLAEPTSPQPGAYGIATLRWHSSRHGQKENGPWENAPAPTQNKRGSPLKTSPWYKSLSATYLAG